MANVVVIPSAAKVAPVDQAEVDHLQLRLHQLRASALVANAVVKARTKPVSVGDKDWAAAGVILLPPFAEEQGYIAMFGMAVAQRERAATLELVQAHVRAATDETLQMLGGFEAVLRKTKMRREADEVKAACAALSALGETIASSLVRERGPLRSTVKVKLVVDREEETASGA